MLSDQEQQFEQDRPHDAAAELQRVIDGLSDGHEAIVRPLGQPSDTADRKPLWLWADELDAKHNAKGTIRIVQPFSAADYQCQDEGLEALPDEQITDLDGNSNYIVYHRAQGTSSDGDSATILLKRRVTDLTLKVACSVHGLGDRNIARLRQEVDELRQELETDRTERQGEIDALSKHFLSEIAEIRAAQSADGLQIAQTQADISRLESDLDDFEETFEPAPSPAVQWVRAAAFLLIGFGIGAIAMSVNDQAIWRESAAKPVDAKILKACESTQYSYYAGLGFAYPSTQKMAESDCRRHLKP